VAAKARSRNLHTKRQVREALKTFTAALETGKPAEVHKAHQTYMSAIDTAAKKNVIHKNKAARFKARFSKRVKEAGIKQSKTTDKKTVAKKPAQKKKKTIAKKAKNS
jgi:small subunit ribosomal protein S20